MKIVDAIATILKHEGVKFLSCFPTTSIIQACAAVGIRPQVCAQERVGSASRTGIAGSPMGTPWGCSRCSMARGRRTPFPVATAFSDSTPVLLLPLGHRDRAQVFPLFSSARTYASVTRAVETLNLAGGVRGDAAGL